MKEFDWPIRVYYDDTDTGGVVYHARYLAFYEHARTEMLRQFNISQQLLLEDQGVAFVVKNMNIDYVYPARLDDLLIVRSVIENIKRASLVFKQQIIDEHGRLYSRADVVIACVDLNKKRPCVFPELFISEFNKWKI